MQKMDCPCKRVKCKRFGKCDECREHHEGKRLPPYCEQKTKKREKEGKEK